MHTRIYTENGQSYTILIGQCAMDNWTMIDISHPEDIWFHLGDGLASCHVILCLHGMTGTPTRQLIKHCCVICKAMTNKYERYQKIPVIYTTVNNISRGEYPGEVIIRSNHSPKTIVI